MTPAQQELLERCEFWQRGGRFVLSMNADRKVLDALKRRGWVRKDGMALYITPEGSAALANAKAEPAPTTERVSP